MTMIDKKISGVLALLLFTCNPSLAFAPVNTQRIISITKTTPNLRDSPLFLINNTETFEDKLVDEESFQEDKLDSQWNHFHSFLDSVSSDDEEQVMMDQTVLINNDDNDDTSTITKAKKKNELYQDKTMNVISSERKLKRWLNAQHLDDCCVKEDELPMDVIMERLGDTMEDVMTHVRRKRFEDGKSPLSPEQESSRKTVVVLGSGWGAHALLKVADPQKLRLLVISPTNHFVFTPMLASSAVGTVEYRSMTEAVRSANPMIEDYLQGKAIGINVQNQTITVQMNSLLEDVRHGEQPPILQVPYDHLVCSVGCQVNHWGVPGAADKALRLKTLDDARKLRKSIAESFEYASRPDIASEEERKRRTTFLIVGGGPTGVELAGEILDLTRDVTKPKGSYPKLKDTVRVVIAHAGPDLLPPFEPRLRQEAKKSLENKGAEVLLNTRVTEVGDGYAKLQTKVLDEDGKVVGNEEMTLPMGLTVWCAGTGPVPFIETLLQQLPPEARHRDGRVNVDRWLRPPMPSQHLKGSIFVLGDAAAFSDEGYGAISDSPLPQTAQVAGQQGAFLARLFDRGYDLTVTPPLLPANSTGVFEDPMMRAWLELRGLDQAAPGFIFLNLGILAYLGGGEALSQVQIGDFPLFSYFGSVAYVLWRSVYLVKQVATRNRVLVTFDWIKSFIFGRDMTRF